MERVLNSGYWLTTTTYLNLPAVSVPTSVRALNVPIGVQIVGPRHGEDQCLNAAQALEDAFGCPSNELLSARPLIV